MTRNAGAGKLATSGSLTLAVGWRSGKKVKLAQLTLSAEVESALRAVAEAAVENLAGRTTEPWAPDADLSEETYLEIDQAELGDAPALAAEHGGASLADVLLRAEGLSVLDPRNLPTADLAFYAIVVGSEPGARLAFLRRVNARRGLKGGKFLTSYSDVLHKIEAPVFAFDQFVDLIFLEGSALILSQSAFVALFRAQETLVAQIPKWVDELAQHVPIAADAGERLRAKAMRDSRSRTRLEAIVKRGHLVDVSSAVIKGKMHEVGLNPDLLLDDSGHLRLEDADVPLVLQFLNEDLFPGVLTGKGFRADKKAAR